MARHTFLVFPVYCGARAQDGAGVPCSAAVFWDVT